LITLQRGGTVRLNRLGAQPVYGASAQNGITTTAYGEWRESFGFLSQDGQPLNQDPSSGIAIVWNTKGDILPPTDGASQRFICPPGGTAQPVWGTDIYTADSSICTAAVHAGRIGFERGGVVTVTVAPGQASYARGERNGVVSSDYGSWGRSLVFTSTEGRPRAPSS
jgi:hypothetical protein